MMAIGSAVQYTSIGEVNPLQRFLAQTRLPDRWYKVVLWRKSSMVFHPTGNGHVGNSTWNTVCAVTVPLSTGQHEQHEPSNDMIHQVALQPCSLTHPWPMGHSLSRSQNACDRYIVDLSTHVAQTDAQRGCMGGWTGSIPPSQAIVEGQGSGLPLS